MRGGGPADRSEPSQAALALPRRVRAPSPPCSPPHARVEGGAGEAQRALHQAALHRAGQDGCPEGRVCPPGSGCKHVCRHKGLSVKLGLCRWEQKVL